MCKLTAVSSVNFTWMDSSGRNELKNITHV